MTKASFPPIADSRIRILVLGSIPGDRSIAMQEYYAHPQNRFWKVMAHITGQAAPSTYAEKQAMLLQAGIGLWDVARTAERIGSMDSAIRNETPNDLDGFLDSHPHVRVVAFNGQKARQMFRKFFAERPGITYLSLPGTSPANAACTPEKLCQAWRKILEEG